MKEIETLQELDKHLEEHASWQGVVVQGLDLTGYTESLRGESLGGAVFLGCAMEPEALDCVYQRGAMIFPQLPAVPFNPYRGKLYTVEEIFDGFHRHDPDSYEKTFDNRVYHHWEDHGRDNPNSILETLARRLHDHAITDAMRSVLDNDGNPRKVVAIMGGHSLLRNDPAYRDAAYIARELTRKGFFMASGGGPGAMEATHVGAWFAGRPDEELDAAIKILSRAPSYKDVWWMSAAFEVRHRYPLSEEDAQKYPSLGIPTWLYGHEPPNAFATHVAKYFANSVREDGLLAIATYGVIFAPGSAGTIQEVFQDSCQNHYKTAGVVSPMVFLNEEYWTQTKPVYPLLKHLAEGKEYAPYLSIHDDPNQVVSKILDYDRDRDAGALKGA